ncbi:MAG: hypothetical protein NTY19_04125 [Planctomycetota bacterium]|nr:hypothetical protein [Planctomycetota bacterium]
MPAKRVTPKQRRLLKSLARVKMYVETAAPDELLQMEIKLLCKIARVTPDTLGFDSPDEELQSLAGDDDDVPPDPADWWKQGPPPDEK